MGLKVWELARDSNIKSRTVANAESYNELLSLEYATRIAAVLGTDPESLLLRDVRPGRHKDCGLLHSECTCPKTNGGRAA